MVVGVSDWTTRQGSLCDDLHRARPSWVTGSLSTFDARYLFSRAIEAQASIAVEIGTASGFSTAVLAHALAIAARARNAEAFRVVSYDAVGRFYADETKAVGDAARVLLPEELLACVEFRNPARALDVADDFPPDSLAFLFIDASHRHPWPALDLLATLPCLRPGAEVVLHDINLPRLNDGQFPVWGAKHVFDDLSVGKAADGQASPPNIGSIYVPDDKETLRRDLLEIVSAHEWEAKVGDDVVSRASGALVMPSVPDEVAALDNRRANPSVPRASASAKRSGPDYSSFVVLLARQRSGTNSLRSVLDQHPAIQSLPEIFHPEPSPDAHLERETNYFGFLDRHPLHGFKQTLASREAQDRVFLDYLDYLRCFAEEERFLLLDVKYTSTHHIQAPFRFITAEPELFSLIRRHRIRVLNLKRRNYLRYHLSMLKAEQSKQWTASAESGIRDFSVTVPVNDLLPRMELCRSDEEFVDRSFQRYDQARTIDYEDLFPELGGAPSLTVVEGIAGWLGIEPSFPITEPRYRKQAIASLEETIENYGEVADALRGTDFEYCLEDERMYRAEPNGASVT